MNPAELVQAQLDAHNVQDIAGFCACFAPDAALAEFGGAVTHAGLAAVRQRYASLFAEYPENRARLVSRMAVGDVVIDEEEIVRSPEMASFRAIAIYTVKNGLITRVDFVR
jgi:hypothetical protein